MEAIIHIGTEKTGTTSLQEYLLLNERLLNKVMVSLSHASGLPNNRSLAAYSMDFNNKDDFFCHRNIKNKDEKDIFDENFLAQFHMEMKSLIKSTRIVIFSSEHFSSRLTTIKEITKLKSLLALYFDTFKVVCYLRPQLELAISHYSTALRIGESRSVNDYVDKECQLDNYYFNYLEMINNWRSVFDSKAIYLRSFSKNELINKSLYDDFFNTTSLTRLKNAKEVLPQNRNSSFNSIGQHLLMQYNCLPHRIAHNSKGIAKADGIVKLIEMLYSGQSPDISEEVKADKHEVFKESNNVLMDMYSIYGLNTLKEYKPNSPSKFNFSITKIKLLLKIIKLFICLPSAKKIKYRKRYNKLIISLLMN